MDKNKYICNVEVEIIEAMIKLIQKRYTLAEEATYYLETQAYISNTIGMANIRDVLSHFYVILSNDHLTLEKKKVHVALAEEHLRRAIVEPYEQAVDLEIKKIRELYSGPYITEIVAMEQNLELTPFLKQREVEETLNELAKLISVGRKLKNRNIWDQNWEEATTTFLKAFEIAKKLRSSIEHVVEFAKYNKIVDERTQLRKIIENLNKKMIKSSFLGIFITILMTLLGIIIGILLNKISLF